MPLIGINQDTFHIQSGGFPCFDDMIRGIAELGLDLFEFCPEYREQTPDVLTPQRRREALALAKSLGVELAVHGSFASVNICFINDHTRAEAVEQFKREIQLAHDLESDVITIHPGPPVGHAKWYDRSMFYDMMLRSYEELVAFAEPLGVRICTENTGGGWIGTQADLEKLLGEIDSPGFGLTFDFGHHNLIYKDLPVAERTVKMRQILAKLKDKIWVLHIHDNNGARDEHAALGSGEIDWDASIDEVLELGINAYWSMELAGRESALTSKAVLERILSLTP